MSCIPWVRYRERRRLSNRGSQTKKAKRITGTSIINQPELLWLRKSLALFRDPVVVFIAYL
jgi:hypothetical protein